MDLGTMVREAPPVSRTLAITALALSFTCHALGILEPFSLVYIRERVFNLSSPEIWRPVTAFLLTTPKIGIILDSFFFFKYASDCETSKFTRASDFVVFLTFVGGVILALSHFVGAYALLSPLILALAYYWTAFEPPAGRVSFFIVTFPVKYLPPAMLLMTFINGGPHALLIDLTGIVAAHAYIFLTEIWPRASGGRPWISTPGWVEGIFRRMEREPPPPPPPPPPRRGSVLGGGNTGGGTGSATGVSLGRPGDGWSHRGQGHRLGN